MDPLSSAGISCVIVVDALDECVDDQPASAILSLLGRSVKQLPFVKSFVTGRPEPRIRWVSPSPPGTIHPNIPTARGRAVQRRQRHPTVSSRQVDYRCQQRSDFDLPDPSPCDEDLATLMKKSSGLFVFASTLVRFIESEYHEPNERLRLIVIPPDSTVHKGCAGIEPLYHQQIEEITGRPYSPIHPGGFPLGAYNGL